MDIKVILAYFVMPILDAIIISDARHILLDFLIGQRNRKNANKIHAEQSFADKVKMGYIQPMLKKNASTFKKYHILYLSILYSLLPQYIVMALFHVFASDIMWYPLGFFGIIKILLGIFYWLELGPNKMSVYAQKKKR